MATLKSLKLRAATLDLSLVKVRGQYEIEELRRNVTGFGCAISVYGLEQVEKQLDYFEINHRFTNSKVVRDNKGNVIWRKEQ